MTFSLSSLDIHHLVNEWQFLVGSKIDKIFQQDTSDILLFALHVSGQGKQFLYMSVPDMISVCSFKPVFPDVPPHFCSALRRKINAARITAISQQGFERIINIDFTTKHGNSRLVIEMFSKGNVILHDSEMKILSCLRSDSRTTRFIRPGKPYIYPPKKINPLEMDLSTFNGQLKSSDRESIVKSLAMDFSLGGTYAEEVVFIAKVDKYLSPNDIDDNTISVIFDAMKSMLTSETFGNVVLEKPYSFKLESKNTEEVLEFPSFNDAVSSLALKDLERDMAKDAAKDQKAKLSKLDRIIKAQTFQIKGLEKSEVENQEKGEIIYKNYTKVDSLLKNIQEARKTHSWKEIKEALKNNPDVTSLDEHNGSITLELE